MADTRPGISGCGYAPSRKSSFDTSVRWVAGADPSAIAVADVDAQGNLTNVRITKESPTKGWCGPLLAKTFQGEKFIPAMENGKSVPGQFDLIVNYEKMFNPDFGAVTGSHITRDDSDSSSEEWLFELAKFSCRA